MHVGGFKLTIDEMIAIFGKPKYVFTTHKHNGDIDFRLFIPEKGALATLSKDANNAVISGDDTVETLQVIDSNFYDGLCERMNYRFP